MAVGASSSASYIDRAFEYLERIDYRQAQTESAKDEIYRLRYRAYLNEGAIQSNPDGRLKDRFDDQPNSWLFGLYIDDTLVSSLRVCVATTSMPETPAVDAFAEALRPILAQGKTIVDPNRFVADPVLASKSPYLPYMTLRLAYVACVHFNADVGTATVRPEHRAFYSRVFLHRALCEPRPYPTLTKPLGLMAVDYRTMRDKVFERYPFFRSTEAEREQLFGPEISERAMLELAVPHAAFVPPPQQSMPKLG